MNKRLLMFSALYLKQIAFYWRGGEGLESSALNPNSDVKLELNCVLLRKMRRFKKRLPLLTSHFIGTFDGLYEVNCFPGFPSHAKTIQSYSAIIVTVWLQAGHTLDHKVLWCQADHTLDIYGPVYDTPCSIEKQSLWFQPDRIPGHIWFSLWSAGNHKPLWPRVWAAWSHKTKIRIM